MDVNKTTTDRIFQLGYGPNGKLSLSAGTGGWAWRFGDGGDIYGTVSTCLDFKYGREVVVRITNHLNVPEWIEVSALFEW